MSSFTDKLNKPLQIDVHEMHGKTVIIRVEDPNAYEEGSREMTRLLRKAGAALVLVAKPSDKIDVLSDEDLEVLGLKRIGQET